MIHCVCRNCTGGKSDCTLLDSSTQVSRVMCPSWPVLKRCRKCVAALKRSNTPPGAIESLQEWILEISSCHTQKWCMHTRQVDFLSCSWRELLCHGSDAEHHHCSHQYTGRLRTARSNQWTFKWRAQNHSGLTHQTLHGIWGIVCTGQRATKLPLLFQPYLLQVHFNTWQFHVYLL